MSWAIAARKDERDEVALETGLRVIIALLAALIFGREGTALAQATNPPEIRLTPKIYPRTPFPIPRECGALNRPNILNPSHTVYCGTVPSASDSTPLSQLRTPTYEQQLQAAKRGFSGLDLNHDGVISRKEWSVMQAQMVAPVPHRGRVQLMCATDQQFKLMDSNHDGKITFAEFTADNFGRGRQPNRGCY